MDGNNTSGPNPPHSSEGPPEEVVDTIAKDDDSVPPEFRGCDVVAVSLDEGTKIFYKGSGFSMTEDQAKILIQAYRIEKETIDAEPAPRQGGDPDHVSAWETQIGRASCRERVCHRV